MWCIRYTTYSCFSRIVFFYNMNSFKYSTLLFLTALISSCTGAYDEDIANVLQQKNAEKTITISGIITSEYKQQTIIVSRSVDFNELYVSSDISSKQIKNILTHRRVDGAKVYVEVAGKKYEFKEMHKTGNLLYDTVVQSVPTIIDIPYDAIYYESIDSFAGIPNQEHKLVVEVEGKTYTATDVMPQVSEISFTEKSPLCRKVSHICEDCDIEFDTATVFPYYLFGQQEAYIIGFKTIDKYDKEEEAKGNYKYMYHFDEPCYSFRQLAAPQLMGAISDVAYIEIAQGSWTERWYTDYYTDSLLVTKMSCSPSYEYYLYCLFQNRWGNDFDFGTMPSNAPTNITNGGVGFFAACDVKKKFFSRRKIIQLAESIGNIIEF